MKCLLYSKGLIKKFNLTWSIYLECDLYIGLFNDIKAVRLGTNLSSWNMKKFNQIETKKHVECNKVIAGRAGIQVKALWLQSLQKSC